MVQKDCRARLEAFGVSSENDTRAVHELNWEMLNFLHPLQHTDAEEAILTPVQLCFEVLSSRGLAFLDQRADELRGRTRQGGSM